MLLVWTSFALILCASSKDECSFDDVPLKEKIDFGSLNTFYSIARSIADGLQKPLSPTSIKKLQDIIERNEMNSKTMDEVKEVVDDQMKGLFIFVGVGVTIALLSLAVGLVILFMQCCCCLKKKDEDTKGVPLWKTFIYITILVASFSFIVGGVIVHNRSSSYVFYSIDNLQYNTTNVLQHLELLVRNGFHSTNCAIDKLLRKTIDTLIDNIQQLFSIALNDLQKLCGVSDLNQISDRVTKITNGISICDEKSKELLQSVEALQPKDQECARQLPTIKKILKEFHANLQKFNENTLSTSSTVKETINQLHTQFNGSVQPFVTDGTRNVIQTWESIQQKMNETISDTVLTNIGRLSMKFSEYLDQFQSSLGYTTTKKFLDLLITIPALMILFFVLMTILLLVLRICNHGNDPVGVAEEVFSSLSMVGFYVTVFFMWIVIGLSCMEYVSGWGVSTVCRPLFDDPTFSVYSTFKNTVDLPDGYRINVSLDHLLERCHGNQTMFVALDGDNALNTTALIRKAGIVPLTEKLAAVFDSLKQEVYDHMKNFTAIQTQVKYLLNNSIEFNSNGTKLLLAQCSRADHIRKAEENMDNLARSLKDLKYGIWDLSNLTIFSLKSKDVVGRLDAFHVYVADWIEAVLTNTTHELKHELSTSVFPCRGLSDIYEYSGSVLCKAIGDPIHGTWAAAAMTGLWFLPAAIVMFIRAGRRPVCCSSSLPKKKKLLKES